jgi:rubrerythrin
MPKTGPAKEKRDPASALMRALRFEREGKRLFTAAADKSADPFAKQVFALLAQMETKHMEDIQAIARELEKEGRFPKVPSAPHDARMRQFRREHSRIRKEKVISGDAADGMRKALAFEAEGREMYIRMSKAATHPQEKRFFKLLSTEEDSHFNIIYEYLDFLERRGLRMQDG